MIGRLRGQIVLKDPPHLILDVQGVGYEIQSPLSTFSQLPSLGESVTLITHLVVREDAHLLYGFLSEAERHLFRTLLGIRGVGARMALAILSGMDAGQFALCVERGDVASLTRLPGIGKKTAERLLVEMRDRIDPTGTASLAANPALGVPEPPVADAIGALIALGYKPAEARRMVEPVRNAGTTEDIIRAALRAANG